MKFVNKIDEKEYENFVKNHKKSHFLQSYTWGEFCKVSKGLEPHYVGLKNNNKLVASALLLEKKLPFGYSYFYSPRGIIIDYSNYPLIKEFTLEIAKYIKQHNGLFFKIDPDIKLHTIDKNAIPIEGENNYELVNFLKHIGYKRKKLTYFFESEQPRFTFRINLKNKNSEQVISNYSKTARRFLKKANNYDIEVTIGKETDVKEFSKLMLKTEKRQNFYSHNEKYYQTFYEYFKENNNVEVMIAKLNLEATIKKLEHDLESGKKISDIDIESLKEIYKDNPTPIISSYITVFYGNKAWYLYGANDMDYKYTYANYKLFNYQILTALDRKAEIFDEFGTVGIPNSKKKVAGLHEFKKKFGGDYTEFIGEFDYIVRPVAYFFFMNLIFLRRKLIKLVNRLKIKNQKTN